MLSIGLLVVGDEDGECKVLGGEGPGEAVPLDVVDVEAEPGDDLELGEDGGVPLVDVVHGGAVELVNDAVEGLVAGEGDLAAVGSHNLGLMGNIRRCILDI